MERGVDVGIRENVRRLLSELPPGVQLVAAAKARQPEEILEAIEAGVRIIGENYVQDAERAYRVIGNRAEWHLIGHLQRNKVTKAVPIFDLIQTVDSLATARELDLRCARTGRVMPVLIEINSGGEEQKAGVLPRDAEPLVREVSTLSNLKVMGLMTMGPPTGEPEDCRPYFAATSMVFNRLKSLNLPNVEMRHLSMGMSNSYKIAIEEGANIIRIGSKIFGERQ